METKKTPYNIAFIAHKNKGFFLSCALILISLLSLSIQGLELGIDFTGGTLVEIGYTESVDLESIRQKLKDSGFENARAQYFGSSQDILIRISSKVALSSADLSQKILAVLADPEQTVELRRIEFVGAQVGEELRQAGELAMVCALLGILIYVAMRFQMRFSVGAIAALIHDVIITLGFFSVARLDFDLTVLAAILAVIGYSLNDTIVVFDRVRENFRALRTESPAQIFNVSINQTLSRTILTSSTTLLVLVALFIFGGEIIHNFATALITGVIIGTYSSIFVASPVTLQLGISKTDLMPVEKEAADL